MGDSGLWKEKKGPTGSLLFLEKKDEKPLDFFRYIPYNYN